jgi:hypothetical protein
MPTISADMMEAITRFDRQADDIVRNLARTFDAEAPPSMIYHYTNDAGLRAILESGRLWLTDIFDLNDPSELRHSFTHAVESLGRWAETVSSDKPEATVFSRHFAEFRDRGGLQAAAHYFVCSFSCCGDELGQWRAYADYS